ncbi:MAG TPA: hypothetical protein VH500_08005 [Nitrososphaeraceae archaeon]|jgi:hypothetical protein
MYNRAIYRRSKGWRFWNIYAAPIWIYLIGFLVAVLVFYLIQEDKPILKLNVSIQVAALHAATWGCVGGIFRGLWYLKEEVSDRKYVNSTRIYYFSVPFLGGLFGAIMYFILVTGLFVIAPTQAVTVLSHPTIPTSNLTANNTGGLGNTTGSNTSNNSDNNNTNTNIQVSTLAIIPLATLAGFQWEWFVKIFTRIGDSFKDVPEPKPKMNR